MVMEDTGKIINNYIYGKNRNNVKEVDTGLWKCIFRENK